MVKVQSNLLKTRHGARFYGLAKISEFHSCQFYLVYVKVEFSLLLPNEHIVFIRIFYFIANHSDFLSEQNALTIKPPKHFFA